MVQSQILISSYDCSLCTFLVYEKNLRTQKATNNNKGKRERGE